MTTILQAYLNMEAIMNLLPCAIASILTEVIVNGGPWSEVVRQHPPRTTATGHIQNSVDDPPEINRTRTSTRFSFRQQWHDQLPLAIRQVGRVAFCIHSLFIGRKHAFLDFSYTLSGVISSFSTCADQPSFRSATPCRPAVASRR